MPPADNSTPTPAPTPAPEAPKQGFFAKLFGKKPKEPAVPANHESQTPPPQLSDTTTVADNSASVTPVAPGISTPTVGADVTPVTGADASSDPSATVPTVGAEELPPTLDVPPSVAAEPIKVDDVSVSPSLPTQPPAAGGESPAVPPEAPTVDSTQNPQP